MHTHQVTESLQHYKYEKFTENNFIEKVSKSLMEAQRFNLSNVNGLIETYLLKKETFTIRNMFTLFIKDMTDARLPYKKTWVEFQYTERECDLLNNFQKTRIKGMLAEEMAPDIIKIILFGLPLNSKEWGVSPQAYYISIGKCYHENINFSILNINLDPSDYTFLPTNVNIVPVFLMDRVKYPDNMISRTDLFVLDYFDIIVLYEFLKLLSCANITTEKINPSATLNKARQKRGKLPLLSYHILKPKPMGKKQESIPKNLWENRIHLCRSHYKVYTKEKPLFGNIVGRFLWQSCVKGRNKKGIVIKDYEIDPDNFGGN